MRIFSVNFINKAIQILLVFLFIINVGAYFFMPLLSVYATSHVAGATLATVGMTIVLYAIAKSVFQIPIAKMLDSRPGEKDDFIMLLLGLIIGTIYSFGFLFIDRV